MNILRGHSTSPPARASSNVQRVTLILWLLFSAFIVYGTTIPFHFVGDPGLVRSNLSRVSLNPLTSPDTGALVSVADFAQNLLLFAPFGMLAMGTLRRGAWLGRVAAVTALAAFLSGAVEVLQLFTVERVTALSDVLANTTGALAGAVMSGPSSAVLQRAASFARRRRWISVPAAYPLLVATCILVLSAWAPFDVTLEPDSLGWKVRLFLAYPWQLGGIGDEPLTIVRYAVATVLAVCWSRQIGLDAPVARGATAVAALAVALEGSQILIESRMPGLADALAGLVGVTAGALLSVIWSRRTVESAGAWPPGSWASVFWSVAGATAAALAVLYLSQSASDVLQLALAYFPLGFVLATGEGGSGRVLMRAVGLALLFAAPWEYLQSWRSDRSLDLAGAAAAIFGAGCGVWAARAGWAAFRRVSSNE